MIIIPKQTAEMPTQRVRFNDECNQIVEVQSVITVEEGIVEKLWYQPWEHKENKRAIKRDARQWRKSGLGILLRDTFGNPNPQHTQTCLDAFVQLADADYVRGIERHLSQQHDEMRVERKRFFVQDVVEQARYLQAHPNLTEDEKLTKLAEFSTLQSKCAEVFAHRIGKADERVVRKGEDPKAASKLVSKLFRNEFRRSRSLEAQSSANVMPTHESRHKRNLTPRRISVPPLSSGGMMMGI
ncbi:expressed unknown protein [Seminavis robusta]|uniref:Uncharacterized protein n=1 Tax=Seminavis robusta TaxID=568900 RepID=A0A9N8H8I2_9STRA|nr:expressed unknown protein [Seminavis robusta]|eukprot:Sro170_g075360.1 n/a (241) ;mRNA; r:29039-29761